MKNNNGPLSFEATIGNSQFNASLDAMEQRTGSFTAALVAEGQKWEGVLKTLGVAISGALVLAKAKEFVSDMVRVRGEFQQLDIAFTTMLRSKQKADQLMGELVEFAATTPFGLRDTASAAKQLLAYGSSAAQVKSELRILGDVASGVSQPLGELVYLYGTLRTQGRAYAVDIRQFAGRGIPIYQELAKVLKINKDEVQGFVEAGKVGFKEVEQAFQNMTGKGGLFGGLMEAQSKSIPGLIERLKDGWDQLLNRLGTQAQPEIEGTIELLGELMENYEQVGRVVTGLVATYGTYKAAVIAVAALKGLETLTLAQSATALGAETVAKLDNAATTANLSAAISNEMATRAAAAQATLVQMRAEVSEAAAKKAAAIQTARTAAAEVTAAEAKLAAALAAQAAGANDISRANKATLATNVEIAAKERAIVVENALIASRRASAATSEFNTARIGVETAARNASTLAASANTAATAANVAAVNADAIANTRLTAAQQLRVVITKKLDAATNLLNKTMLGNPYVLMATLIVGIAAATWALYDGTSAQEGAQKRLNEILEKSKEKKQEMIDETTKWINTIKSETESIYEQILAYEALQKKYPELFSGVSLVTFKTKDLVAVQKELNKIIAQRSIDDLIAQYKEAAAVLETLERHIREGTARVGSQQLDKQRILVSQLKFEVDQANRAMERAAELERVNAMTAAEKLLYYKQQQSELELQRNGLQLTLLLSKKIGQEFGLWQNSLNAIQLDNLNRQLEEVAGNIAALQGPKKNKSFFEKEQKAAEEAWNAIPIDELGSPAARQAKKDYDAATTALEKYRLTERKGRKPKKIDIPLPEGSLGEIDRQIKKAQEALNSIPADQISRVQAMHETLLRLTEARIEAAKIVEFRGWEETLEYKRKLYADYEKAQEVGYEQSAKKQFSALREEGENYIDFLKKQIEPLEAELYGGGDLSDTQFSRLVILTKELNTAMGISTPMEKFKERLDNAKDSADSVTDYIGTLREELEKLNSVPANDRDGTWYAQFKDINERIKGANKDIVGQLSQFLQQVKGTEEARLAIVKKYADLRAKATDKQKPFIDKAEAKDLKDLAFEASEAFKNMNKVIAGKGRQALVAYIAKLKELYTEAVKVYGQGSSEANAALNQLNDGKEQLEDMDTQAWVNLAQVIGQAGDELSGLEGTLGSIGALLAGATGQANYLASALKVAKSNSSGNGNTGDTVGAIASGAGNLVGMLIGSIKKKKEQKKQRELEAIAFQVELNKALNEEIRLRTILTENIFFKDYAGRIADSYAGMTDAVNKYNKALINLADNGKSLTGTKNVIDWGNVAGGAVTGAAAGAAAGSIIPVLGTAVGAVIGAVVGGVIGLISTATKSLYGPLLQQYPQLVDANGMLNKSLAETLISTNQVDEKTKIWLQDLINAADAMEEARKQITDIVSELAGNIGSELRDVLVDAFRTGEDAAYQFSKTVEKTLENALANLIYSAVFSKAFSVLQKNLEDSLLGSGRSFADVFAEFLSQSDELTDQFNEAMKAAQEEAKKKGFDLFGDDDGGGSNSAAGGISRSITEETADLISGQINAMRINQAASLNLLRQQSAQFDVMTHYLGYLVWIDRRLARLNNNEPWRALGFGENPEI